MRLTLKLTAALSLVIACGLVVQSLIFVERLRSLHIEETRDDLEILGRVLATASGEIWATQGESRARAFIERADEKRTKTRIHFSALVATYDSSEQGRSWLRDDALVQHNDVLVAGAPVARLELVRTRKPERKLTSSILKSQLLIAAGVFAACGGLALAVGLILVGRPVHRLIEHARRVADGDFDVAEDRIANDELGHLAREMRLMSEQLALAHERVREERRGRTQAFEQLRHADRLSTVGELASGIAHELGTPLNVVSGRAALIAADASLEERIRKGAQTIVTQAEHMENIVRQLLDYARQDSQDRVRSRARELIANAIGLVEPLAEVAGVELKYSETPLEAFVDSGGTLQVLTNLIVNAIQAMPDGGEVELSATQAQVLAPPDRVVAPGHFVCFSVRDQGEGIAAEDLDHIFEAFFTTKDRGVGTGLGLSVSNGIVRDHGGWIALESEPSVGSCFRVFLPLREAP